MLRRVGWTSTRMNGFTVKKKIVIFRNRFLYGTVVGNYIGGFLWNVCVRSRILEYYIVTHMTIARQLLVKHTSSSGVTLSTLGHPLLGNGPINTNSRITEEKCFPWDSCRGITRGHRTKHGGVQRSTGTTTRMGRVLVICEVGRLAIAL
jgi:hypothetical protein